MKQLQEMLTAHPQVSDYKINTHKKESYELFFVKGALETVRCTDTTDREVTVYVDHGECKGDAQFFVYASTTPQQIQSRIEEAVGKALLIRNQAYSLPEAQTGDYTVDSNFADYPPEELAAQIALAVFAANTLPNGSLNSVEIFINKHTQSVCNSRGLHKTQVFYDAMVEAIPTYNGESQSVELYEQYNFSNFDAAAVAAEIGEKMEQVKARYEAVTPEQPLEASVILNIQEVAKLFASVARNLNYATVYSHSNLFSKGDAIQKAPQGDKLGITMTGQVTGSIRSSCFDADGLTLDSVRLVEQGSAVSYYGSNRYGQYLGETPTGDMPCLLADTGTGFTLEGKWLEVVSMSGLQVDFFNDYIGGEVRLAYYHDGEKTVPVTGISISGKASQVLESLWLSKETGVYDGYCGPCKACTNAMKVF